MNSNVEWEVLPIFSKPLAISKIDNDISRLLQAVCSKVEWEEDADETGYLGGWSSDRNILDSYPDIKAYLENFSLSCLKDLYRYFVDIKITTSWFTRSLPNGRTNDHSHCNSWFSSVLYFDEYEESSNKLVLNTDAPRILISQKEENLFNGHSLTLPPQSDMIVLFPSEVRHYTTTNKSNKTRYSLAFNIMPKGFVGEGDSSYTYK
jgi:uncharacterized protein (TIGR02466 family)